MTALLSKCPINETIKPGQFDVNFRNIKLFECTYAVALCIQFINSFSSFLEIIVDRK